MWSPFSLSIQVALGSTLISSLTGIGLGWLAMKSGRTRQVLDLTLTLPLVLPPTVVGLFLLILFSPQNLLGHALVQSGIQVIFTPIGAWLAAFVVALPLMYRSVRAGIESMDGEQIEVARTLGMCELEIFVKIVLPQIRPSLMAGLILSFTRALGEFGATMMLAGNIPGKTQTMSTSLYTAVQAGDYETAFIWAFVMCSFSTLMIALLSRCERYH